MLIVTGLMNPFRIAVEPFPVRLIIHVKRELEDWKLSRLRNSACIIRPLKWRFAPRFCVSALFLGPGFKKDFTYPGIVGNKVKFSLWKKEIFVTNRKIFDWEFVESIISIQVQNLIDYSLVTTRYEPNKV